MEERNGTLLQRNDIRVFSSSPKTQKEEKEDDRQKTNHGDSLRSLHHCLVKQLVLSLCARKREREGEIPMEKTEVRKRSEETRPCNDDEEEEAYPSSHTVKPSVGFLLLLDAPPP